MWSALLGDPSLRPPDERNLVRAVFEESSDAGRALVPAEQNTAEFRSALVADLRITYGAYPHDEEFRALIDEFRSGSAEFRGCGTHPRSAHASVAANACGTPRGEMSLDNDVLKVPDHDVRIVTYTAEPGTADEEGLESLRTAAPTARAALPLSSG
ncbi:hypothetical protein NKH77_07940 [Streptomyces sp. M19]